MVVQVNDNMITIAKDAKLHGNIEVVLRSTYCFLNGITKINTILENKYGDIIKVFSGESNWEMSKNEIEESFDKSYNEINYRFKS